MNLIDDNDLRLVEMERREHHIPLRYASPSFRFTETLGELESGWLNKMTPKARERYVAWQLAFAQWESLRNQFVPICDRTPAQDHQLEVLWRASEDARLLYRIAINQEERA